jgi:hypothetical protein
MWGLSSTQTWVLCKVTVPSLVNPTSSVTWMLITNCIQYNYLHLCVYNSFREKTLFLHDCQEELGLALAGCGMGKVIVHAEFSRQVERRYHQQLQFFPSPFRNFLPLFSMCELPYREFELIEDFRDPTPMEQRTQICSVRGEVSWLMCGTGFWALRCAFHSRVAATNMMFLSQCHIPLAYFQNCKRHFGPYNVVITIIGG